MITCGCVSIVSLPLALVVEILTLLLEQLAAYMYSEFLHFIMCKVEHIIIYALTCFCFQCKTATQGLLQGGWGVVLYNSLGRGVPLGH